MTLPDRIRLSPEWLALEQRILALELALAPADEPPPPTNDRPKRRKKAGT